MHLSMICLSNVISHNLSASQSSNICYDISDDGHKVAGRINKRTSFNMEVTFNVNHCYDSQLIIIFFFWQRWCRYNFYFTFIILKICFAYIFFSYQSSSFDDDFRRIYISNYWLKSLINSSKSLLIKTLHWRLKCLKSKNVYKNKWN